MSARSTLLSALGIGFFTATSFGCRKAVPELESRPASSASEPAKAAESMPVKPAGTVQKEDIKVGTGPEAKRGDRVIMHYVGTLTNGTKFDSSRDREDPFEFTLGTGMVIQGWELGIPGMRKGGIRKLTIPPELGYGVVGAPPQIPPNATLVFEVELLQIKGVQGG